MKKIHLIALLFAAFGLLLAQAQEPILNMHFTKNGLEIGGTDAANHYGESYNTTSASVVFDPIKNQYYGVTNYDANGYFYAYYDKDDAVGKALQKDVTWEILFRLDNPKGSGSATTAHAKFFSSQESGGWSISNYVSKGLRMEYVTTSQNNILYGNQMLDVGKFYHIIITKDQAKHSVIFYVNGRKVGTSSIPNEDFVFGNFGSTFREKDLWLCLGGDPSNIDKPAGCQNSTRATFVFANIYNEVLSEDAVETRYDNSDIKYFTEPVKPTPCNDLVLDAVFGKNGTARDASPYAAELGVNGHPQTKYNTEQNKYEFTRAEASCFDFFYRDYFYSPSITSQLGQAYAYEVYCKTPITVPDDYACPLCNQQDGGFGFELSTSGYPYFVCNTMGTASTTCSAGSTSLTSSTAVTTKYTHYVCVFDKATKKTSLYVNGKLDKTGNIRTYDELCFSYAPYLWFGIGADTRANFTHESNDFPWVGEISVARVWGKGLNAKEVEELYNQSQQQTRTISIGELGVCGVCLPFSAVIPEGLTAWVAIEDTPSTVTLAQVAKAGEAIEYGMPVILKGTAGTTYTLSSVDLRTVVPNTSKDNKLQGSFLATTAPACAPKLVDGKVQFAYAYNQTISDCGAVLAYSEGSGLTKEIVWSDSVIAQGQDEPAPTPLTGDNISGRITCQGNGVPNVVVSDGFVVTRTDKDGFYSFRSEKRNGYVFYTIPAGFMPFLPEGASMDEQIFVPFWHLLNSESMDVAETHDFELRVENNDVHYIVVGADSHLANKSNDLNQFHQGFIQRLKEEKADAGSTPIYSTILGDNAWDNYWYSNNFSLTNYRRALAENQYALPFFPVMGNHDNNGATIANENTDFNASGAFRHTMAPNYYSYNLGKIHYVVLDDIYYKNTGTGTAKGISGSRNYDGYLTDYELEWLAKDLQYVSKETPIIFCCHIPVWKLTTTAPFETIASLTGNGSNSAERLAELVKDYKQVLILTGHTHYNYHAHPQAYPNIHENNIAAICAIWWYTGEATGTHNCRDGCPGGYERFYMNGDKISYQYHSIEKNGNAQFRALDMNTVKKFYQENMADFLKKYTSRIDFGKYADNLLLVNVFNYDKDWQIEAEENGKALQVTRIYTESPYHTLTYDLPYWNAGKSLGTDAQSTKNSHMFTIACNTAKSPVTIKATDSFGNTYTQVVNRPINYDLQSIVTENETTLSGVQSVLHQGEQIIAGRGVIKITAEQACSVQIVDAAGQYQTRQINQGDNVISIANRGLYIVKMGDIVKKLFVR